MKTCKESTQTKVMNFKYWRAFVTSHNAYVSTGKTTFLKKDPNSNTGVGPAIIDIMEERKRSVREAVWFFISAKYRNISSE